MGGEPRIPWSIIEIFARVAEKITSALIARVGNHSPNTRVGAIAGKWRGEIKQHTPGKPDIDYECELRFVVKKQSIDGRMEIYPIINDRNMRMEFDLQGNLIHGRFLNLNYRPTDEGALQFGCVIAELDDTGIAFEGRFVGYGSLNNQIVHGVFQASKAVN